MELYEKTLGLSINEMLYAFKLCREYTCFQVGVYTQSDDEKRAWFRVAVGLRKMLPENHKIFRITPDRIMFVNSSQIRFYTSNSTARGGRFHTIMLSNGIDPFTRAHNILWHLIEYSMMTKEEAAAAREARNKRLCLWA